ncbi:MAG TPA: hypothetical protein VIK78_00135 [Ruminiclostridium sp.]
MFLACTPPAKTILEPAAAVMPLPIWKMKTSFGPPVRVKYEKFPPISFYFNLYCAKFSHPHRWEMDSIEHYLVS